jgi:putative SOS response-associated peptidase YedK
MCGRFVGFRNMEELHRHFPIDKACCETAVNYNVVPSQEVLAIVRRQDKNYLEKFHWGLVPSWAKDISIGSRMINARAETVAEKPSFRSAIKKRRCLILADGFYEWKGTKGSKQPFFLRLPEEKPFAFAGLWEIWGEKGAASSPYRSCAIITTAASESVRPVHPRMPVIIKPEKYDQWLDPENRDVNEVLDILSGWHITELIYHPVSTRVNAVRNNDPENMKPLKQLEIEF